MMRISKLMKIQTLAASSLVHSCISAWPRNYSLTWVTYYSDNEQLPPALFEVKEQLPSNYMYIGV